MSKYTIKTCQASEPYPDYKILDIDIQNDWAEFFQSLPHHCDIECCGYGGMIFDAETLELYYPKIGNDSFKDWLIETIKIIESIRDVKYIDSVKHSISGGDPKHTLDLFKSILSYIEKKSAQPFASRERKSRAT